MIKGKLLKTAAVTAVCLNGFAQQEDAAEQARAMASRAVENFEWGLLFEAEGFYAKTGGEQDSDIALATVEFVMDAAVSEWLSGHVGLLWEQDDTEENNLDEAYIIIGTDLYAQAGKYYLPFGNFETVFISDPLTLELAEINKSSVLVGAASERFDVSAGAFKGEYDGVIQSGYAAVNVNVGETAVIGAYVLFDLLETDGLADLNAEGGTRAPGAGGYINVYVGPVMLNAEVVSALDTVDFGFGQKMQPIAYNIEGSFRFAEHWGAGIKYEGSDEFWTGVDTPGAPTALEGLFHEHGVGGVIAYGFHDNAVIGVEYMRLMNKGTADTDLVTVQLAFEI